MSKPIVVFTNFNDALSLISNNDLLITHEKKLFRVNLKNNFDILSITLPLKDKRFKGKRIKTLNCLIPTVKIFVNLQTHKNWSKFIEEYKNILKGRKNKILNWLDNLEDNRVYFCCCIETTVNGVECHRKYLYDILSNGKAKDKAIWVYRNGIETKTTDENVNEEKDSIEEIIDEIDGLVRNQNRVIASRIINQNSEEITFTPSSSVWNGDTVRLETYSNTSNIYPGDTLYIQSDGRLSTTSNDSPIGTVIGSQTEFSPDEFLKNYVLVRLNDEFLSTDRNTQDFTSEYGAEYIDDL